MKCVERAEEERLVDGSGWIGYREKSRDLPPIGIKVSPGEPSGVSRRVRDGVASVSPGPLRGSARHSEWLA